MRHLKMLGLGLVAAFAISAAASASASAVYPAWKVEEKLLKSGESTPIAFNSTGPIKITVPERGLAIVCKSLSGTPTIVGQNRGGGELTLAGCSVAGEPQCKGKASKIKIKISLDVKSIGIEIEIGKGSASIVMSGKGCTSAGTYNLTGLADSNGPAEGIINFPAEPLPTSTLAVNGQAAVLEGSAKVEPKGGGTLEVVESESETATKPEWMVCGKAAKAGTLSLGQFTNKECATEGKVENGGKYELENLGSAKKTTAVGKGKITHLNIAGIGTVTCGASASSIVIKIWTRYWWVTIGKDAHGCTLDDQSCTTAGAKPGEIRSNPLMGWLVYLSERQHGLLVKPEEGTSFESFSCGGTEFNVTGSELGVVSGNSDRASATSTQTFAASGSTPAFSTYEFSEEGPNTLSVEVNKGGALEAAEESVESVKGEKIEVVGS